jgi:hypothetical protein
VDIDLRAGRRHAGYSERGGDAHEDAETTMKH